MNNVANERFIELRAEYAVEQSHGFVQLFDLNYAYPGEEEQCEGVVWFILDRLLHEM